MIHAIWVRSLPSNIKWACRRDHEAYRKAAEWRIILHRVGAERFARLGPDSPTRESPP
jgi:hypothetical protein